MQVAMETHELNVLKRLQNWWEERREKQETLGELSKLDEFSLRELARDCGMGPLQLVQLAAKGEHSADEMYAMMRVLNIDPGAVEIRDAALFRSMQANCADCKDKGQCLKSLRGGDAWEHYSEFCPNAETLNDLRARPEMLAS